MHRVRGLTAVPDACRVGGFETGCVCDLASGELVKVGSDVLVVPFDVGRCIRVGLAPLLLGGLCCCPHFADSVELH